MNVQCIYEDHTMDTNEAFYRCNIELQKIKKNVNLTFIGDHKVGRTNNDVTFIKFDNCSVKKVPKGLTNIFPNIRVLSIFKSKLNFISRENLFEYKNIEKFICESNELEFLPGDLFEDFENLEWISFANNKLKVIEPNIIDHFDNLKLVMFHFNPKFNRSFSIYPEHNSNDSLEEVKEEIFKNFFNSEPQIIKNYLEKLQFTAQKGLFCDLKSFIKDEKTKNFKILINDREFAVHKMLISARCPVIAEKLQKNPDLPNLNLSDIPVDIFEIILEFFYTDKLSGDDQTNFGQLFVAANRLQIKELKSFAAKKVLHQINQDNALDIFNMSNKYDHGELRQKSFEEIKKMYPKIDFKDEWASNPEKVIKLIEGFKKMKEEIQKLQNQFNSLMTE